MGNFRWAIIAGLLVVSACGSPSDRIVERELQLRCGMSESEVERLAGAPLVERAGVWQTHVIDYGSEMFQLGFSDGRLKLARVAWLEKPTRYATYAIRDLCGDAPRYLEASGVLH